jgi:hypothetical protein
MINFKRFFTENVKPRKFVVLLPGGFKPPTLGHYHLIKSYNEHPDVEKVFVLIGPKEREGVTREQSLKLFDLYGITRMPKVSVVKIAEDNPMFSAFNFVENNPQASEYTNSIFGMGSSDKEGDNVRSLKFEKYFRMNPSKLPKGVRVGIPPIIPSQKIASGKDVSATALRNAIKTQNLLEVQSLIPPHVKAQEFLNVFKHK